MNQKTKSRRDFLKYSGLGAAFLSFPSLGLDTMSLVASKMKFGLVTYQWGRDWDIPTLIKNCEKANAYGVELRTEHAHGVEPSLTKAQREEVKKQFADTKVKILGPGTNQQYDFPDKEKLKQSIEKTKAFIQLSHDIGGTGVKVKPNAFHANVPKEQTLEQIGKALNEVGAYAADMGQLIRLEVHGTGTQELPNIKTIMDHAENKNVVVCWNCNDEDLIGQGLEYNFNLVKNRLGDTVHVRELNVGNYPYQQLMNLLVKNKYNGWILMEARTEPADRVQALIDQRLIFEEMLTNAKKA